MSKEKIKIATIGGGSSYTPELVEGFILREKELPVSDLWLVDVKEGEQRQEIIAAMAKRMIRKAGSNIKIHTTLDRREALEGADFVTTQFRVGQMAARIRDERIPLEHKLIGQETNGAGGMFKALRTVPVILDIVKDIQELCPNAWLVNFTNPSGLITESIYRNTTFRRAIGLCNVPINLCYEVAKALGVDVKRVYLEFVGLNHMDFVDKIYLDGNDVTETAIDQFIEKAQAVKNIDDVPWDVRFIKGLKMIPNDYLRYYFKRQNMLDHQLKDLETVGTRGQVVSGIEHDLFEIYKRPDVCTKPKELSRRGGARYSEAACNLIDSLYNNTGDIQTVNVPNNGALIGLEPEEVAEINCVITNHGPLPIATGPIPVPVRGIIQQLKSIERTVIDAAVTGNYNEMLVAMTINPLVADDNIGDELLREMLDANKDYLPIFFPNESR
jgi:6-phospho-beta-glucosidase